MCERSRFTLLVCRCRYCELWLCVHFASSPTRIHCFNQIRSTTHSIEAKPTVSPIQSPHIALVYVFTTFRLGYYSSERAARRCCCRRRRRRGARERLHRRRVGGAKWYFHSVLCPHLKHANGISIQVCLFSRVYKPIPMANKMNVALVDNTHTSTRSIRWFHLFWLGLAGVCTRQSALDDNNNVE